MRLWWPVPWIWACATLTGYMPWGVPPVGIRALLFPSHFFKRPTLAVDSFIDIVRQNWPRNAGLCTPLQETVKQRGPPLWWPQLSHIAWFSEKIYTYHLIKRPFPATLLDLLSILQSGKKISKRLGGIIGCKYKTSLWHLNGFPYGSNLGSTL